MPEICRVWQRAEQETQSQLTTVALATSCGHSDGTGHDKPQQACNENCTSNPNFRRTETATTQQHVAPKREILRNGARTHVSRAGFSENLEFAR